ncbi:MAG: hypothetical protein Q9182_004546 [Xanthomendoza sp. 2 TL-2023]
MMGPLITNCVLGAYHTVTMGVCGEAAPNCTLWSLSIDNTPYHADPDIAGIGVIIAFIASSFLTIAISHTSLLLGIIRGYEDNAIDVWFFRQVQKVRLLRANEKRTKFWQPIMEHLVLTLSDQQLIIGIAILAAGFIKHCSISVYHFSIVSDLAWLLSGAHMTSLCVLHVYLLERPLLCHLRVCFMLLMCVMLMVSCILEGHRDWFDSWNSHAKCLFNDLADNIGGEPATSMTVDIVLLVHNYSTSIFRLYFLEKLNSMLLDKPLAQMKSTQAAIENRRRALAAGGGFKPFVAVATLTASGAVLSGVRRCYSAIASFLGSLTVSLVLDVLWFSFGFNSIMSDRAIPRSKMDGNEDEWGFGQVVPVLLLSSIFLTFQELYCEQKKNLEIQHADDNNNNARVGTERATDRSKDRHSMKSHDSDASEDSEPAHTTLARADTEAGGRGAGMSGVSPEDFPSGHTLLRRSPKTMTDQTFQS